MSRPGSSSYISTALDDAGSVGPPLNIPDILSSARLAGAADRLPIYTTNFWDVTLEELGKKGVLFLRGGIFEAVSLLISGYYL